MENAYNSLRVFRRNQKCTILLWSNSQIEERYKSHASAFLVGADNETPLISSKFLPDNPEKFSNDTAGLVISHGINKIDPHKECTIRIIFGTGSETLAVDKIVLGIGSDIKSEIVSGSVTHMYGYDYESKEWVPLPVDPALYSKAKRDELDKEVNDSRHWWM